MTHSRYFRIRRFAGAVAAVVLSISSAARAEPVDLELVLAVDSSSSVNAVEFDLQMKGLAQAFQHPAVLGAVQAAGDLGIAVSLIQWSDARKQYLAVDWTKITDQASALDFSAAIAATPRFNIGGGTAISGAIVFGLRQFEINDFEGRRRVIDISGDGRANQGSHPKRERDKATALGVTVNGLAILNEDPFVDKYYLRNVIGGTGAFLMTASDYRDFADAIILKLIQEIAGAPVAWVPEPHDRSVLAAREVTPAVEAERQEWRTGD